VQCQVGGGVAGQRPHDPAERAADVRLQLGLGDPGLLEVQQPVEPVSCPFADELGGWRGWTGGEGDAQGRDRGDALGVELRAAVGDVGSPVVADDDRGGLAEGVQEADHVCDQMGHAVVLDRVRGRGLAVAAQIRGERVIPGGAQRGQLVPPGVPQLGEPVEQDDRGAVACLGEVHPETVDRDGPVGDC
jgi:hypothetical protein